MRGGVTMGVFDALASLDRAMYDAGKVAIGVVNTGVVRLEIDDALVHGQIKPDIRNRRLMWRDRGSARREQELKFPDAELAATGARLGTTLPPAAVMNPVDAAVAKKGIQPVPTVEKEL